MGKKHKHKGKHPGVNTAGYEYVIHTDGACAGNPGLMGIGGIIFKNPDGEAVYQFSESKGYGTNNEAEYMAVIKALEYVCEARPESVLLISDSQLVVNQGNGQYSVNHAHLAKLLSRVRKLIRGMGCRVDIVWSPREGNKIADALASKAAGMPMAPVADDGTVSVWEPDLNHEPDKSDLMLLPELNPECKSKIEQLVKAGESARFKDYASLKTTGRDKYSSAKIEDLKKYVAIRFGDKAVEYIEDTAGADTEYCKKVMRWSARGLPPDMALKKVSVDTVENKKNFVTISEASKWASEFLNKEVTESNVSYLLQYGKIEKIYLDNKIMVNLTDLESYYRESIISKKRRCKEALGDDINWNLSFDWVKESERTKHVHRLHPYKGKFIPQLVEYFLDEHTDEYKKEAYFHPNDIIIDPFSGSGTTLIEANELGIHSIGIEISEFNTVMTEVKFADIDIKTFTDTLNQLLLYISSLESSKTINKFEKKLDDEIKKFNAIYFPSPEFKQAFNRKEIAIDYIKEKEAKAVQLYKDILEEYNLKLDNCTNLNNSFIDEWYMPNIKDEADIILNYISNNIKNVMFKKTLQVILSRAMRSVRATTHMDLERLRVPQLSPYFCYKHFKICVPPFSIIPYFTRYAKDTVKRLGDYQKVKTTAFQCVFTGDSRNINLLEEVKNKQFYELLIKNKADGIFTSPPYLGQLDYHEQHAYSYDLFGIKRQDNLEIGAAFKGTNAKSKEEYVNDISQVLINMKKYLKNKAHIFIVANDKYNLYHDIAEKSGLRIIEEFKRPVLNRTARDKTPYSEIIFHMEAK